jgi:midasin (ATPase involved in ribosome maturation)
MKKGYWIVFDEINMALPEILSALHSLLDDDRKIVLKEKDGSIVRPHEAFRFFATMNPCDEYVGTKELNKAFLSRFPMVLNVDFSKQEAEIIVDRTGMVKDDADKLVFAANQVRDYKKKEQLTYTCSTRDLLYCSELITAGFKINEAFELSILNKANSDEREKIQKIFELVIGKKISVDTSDGVKTFDTLAEIKNTFDKYIKNEKKHAEEKKVIKGELTRIKKEVETFKEETEKKLIKAETKIKKFNAVKENIKELLTKAKVSAKDIDAIFEVK